MAADPESDGEPVVDVVLKDAENGEEGVAIIIS